jgi:redox-sensitive bicupin YhaK (pirin superfamily)
MEGAGELHLVQMWVRPDVFGDEPAYRQADVAASLSGAELVPVASGLSKHRSDAPLRLRQAGAGMSIAQLPAGTALNLPDAAAGHLFVTRGQVMLETDGAAELLHAGDAARLTRLQGEQVRAVVDAEILLWELER